MPELRYRSFKVLRPENELKIIDAIIGALPEVKIKKGVEPSLKEKKILKEKIQLEENKAITRGTMVTDIVSQDDENITIKYTFALCSQYDQFNKKRGRQIAEGRMKKGNGDIHTITVKREDDNSVFKQLRVDIAAKLTEANIGFIKEVSESQVV
ncbi:MAG: hypothetical protein KAS32_12915 [Candidatus Peribacteraceae bacterium]|nr:hypothetical protein [Candidatus Peribacteraceae bacterium]